MVVGISRNRSSDGGWMEVEDGWRTRAGRRARGVELSQTLVLVYIGAR